MLPCAAADGRPKKSLRLIYGCSADASPESLLNDQTMAEMLGFYPGTEAPAPLQENIDQIQQRDDGFGMGGGLSLYRHVHFIIRDEPELWEVIDRFNLGEFNHDEGWRMSREHVQEMSAVEVEAVQTIISVLNRKREKAMKPRRETNRQTD